jgi:hypothetical protein
MTLRKVMLLQKKHIFYIVRNDSNRGLRIEVVCKFIFCNQAKMRVWQPK